MKSEQEIRAALVELEADERLTQYKPAQVFSNAPLALIQMAGQNKINMLRWILDMAPFEFPK